MKKNVTFNDIAKYTGFSKTTVSRYFNDPDSLTLENQQKIADALVTLDYKENKVAQSKILLSSWLASHPYLYSDGKYYSCTEEKQSLLNSNLASYERAKAIGVEYPLKWNATTAECTEFSYNDLLALSLSIAAYVAPKVSKQQSIEVQIRNCETVEAIDAIEINYD